MEDLDTLKEDGSLHDEDELFLNHVVQDDHELYYLDACLNEICRLRQDSSGS
jgi:hypothetical protein